MATETKVLNCINCPLSCELTATVEDGAVTNVTGNFCPRGAQNRTGQSRPSSPR